MDIAEFVRKEKITEEDISQFIKKPILQEDGSYKIVNPELSIHSEVFVTKSMIPNLKKDTTTTVGRVIVNRLLKLDIFGTLFDYDNEPIIINKFINLVCSKLITNEVTIEQYAKFLNTIVYLTKFSSLVIPSIGEKLLCTPPKSEALRKKLTKENEEAIKNGDISYVANVEEKVLESIKEELKDEPSMSLYDLKKPSIGNHLKQCIGTFSPIVDIETGKYKIPEGNLYDSISPKDYDSFANMNISGTAARAVSTRDGGSVVKSVLNAMNNISCDEKDSDCGTKRTYKIKLTNFNYDFLKFKYIANQDGKGFILLDDKTKSMFMGREIEIRIAMYCELKDNRKVCNKCAGEIPYVLGYSSVGNLTTKIPFVSMVNASLKQFHDSTISVVELNPFDYMKIDK